jgi:phage shock protein A
VSHLNTCPKFGVHFTLSPQELQVKALADKAEDYQQQEKALKARQQMAKAQQNLMKASSGFSASNKRRD